MGLLEPQQPGPRPKLPIKPTLVDSGRNVRLASCQRTAPGSHAFWLALSSLDKYGHSTREAAKPQTSQDPTQQPDV